MKTEKNGQLNPRNPKKAWETIQELIFADEDMTAEELDEELRQFGIDPDNSVRKLVELAQRLSREPGSGGRVSPYVSQILSQLSAKCYRSEAKAVESNKVDADTATEENTEQPITATPKARAAVLSYFRNYKDETENDRAIRLRNEQRLLEMDDDDEQGEGDYQL